MNRRLTYPRRLAIAIAATHIIMAVLAFGSASPLSAETQDSDDGYPIQLFDGSSLDQWVVSNCEVAIVEDRLKLVEGNGFVRSLSKYKDFVLELEWRPLKSESWDSGVYIRAELPQGDRPWPREFQINLKQGDEANLIRFKDGKSEGLVKPGQWNRMKVTAVEDRVTMHINGQEAWSVEGVEHRAGYIGLQAEVPLGGQFEFRNISLRELTHDSLFNGSDLTHWEPAAAAEQACWDVQDGLLRCTGQKGTWLRSQKQFEDFNLRLEYLLKPGGNSGVYIRVPADGNHHGEGAGIEVQILDDRHSRYADLKDYQFSGSLYAVSPATSRPGHEAGAWNYLEIDCLGQSYRVWLNGALIIETDAEQTAELKPRRDGGFLGLQNHNEEVLFRHLRIGPSLQTK